MEVKEQNERRAVFGHDGNAINKHSVRVYECDGRTFTLDKTLDGAPPFFELTEHPANGVGLHQSILVNNEQYWGDGFKWEQASEIAKDSILRHCQSTAAHQSKRSEFVRAKGGFPINY